MTTTMIPVARSSIGKVVDEVLVVVWRNLAHIPRVPEKLADVTIQPIVFVMLFGYVFGSAIDVGGGGSYREFLLAGVFVQSLAFGVMTTSVGVLSDMKEGIVDRFRSLPIARVSVLLGRAIASLIESALGVTVMTICGLIIGWRAHNGFVDTATAFLLIAFFAFAATCVGTLLGLMVKSAEAAQGIAFVIIFPATFVSNTFVPTGNMPWLLKTIAHWSPISSMVAALRDLFGNPNPIPLDAPWPLHHPLAASLIWCSALSFVGLSLAVRRYSQNIKL